MTHPRRLRLRLLCALLSTVAGLGLVEPLAALVARVQAHRNRVVDEVEDGNGPWMMRCPVTGYRPRPGARARVTRYAAGRVAYQARYTIGPDGWRSVPGSAAAATASRTIVMLGDSFTFGAGCEDGETLPAQLAMRLPGTRVVPVAAGGWGLHQVYAAVRGGLAPVDSASVVVLSMLPAWIARTAGRAPWSPGTPRFELEHGGLEREGDWPAAEPTNLERALPGLAALVRRPYDETVEAVDVERMTALLRALRQELPTQRLVVVEWTDPSRPEQQVTLARAVRASGLEAWRDVELAPGFDRLAIAGDGHPSPAAYALLAPELARRL